VNTPKELIARVKDPKVCTDPLHQALADALEAALPVTVDSAEDLDSLPVGSVVMYTANSPVVVARKPPPNEYPHAASDFWEATGTELGTDSESLVWDGPVTVLYTPTPSGATS
jgi:hypothetical protein